MNKSVFILFLLISLSTHTMEYHNYSQWSKKTAVFAFSCIYFYFCCHHFLKNNSSIFKRKSENFNKEIVDLNIENTHSYWSFIKESFNSNQYIKKAIYCDSLPIAIIIYKQTEDPKVFNIDFIETHYKYQKKGFAKILLDYAINECREKNAESITLRVSFNNNIAINFYEKIGFKKDNNKNLLNNSLYIHYKLSLE